jgi:hypothetical protein
MATEVHNRSHNKSVHIMNRRLSVLSFHVSDFLISAFSKAQDQTPERRKLRTERRLVFEATLLARFLLQSDNREERKQCSRRFQNRTVDTWFFSELLAALRSG